MIEITTDIIHAGRSKNGGWSRLQLEAIGLSWPPKPGWIESMIGCHLNPEAVQLFLDLKDRHLEPKLKHSRLEFVVMLDNKHYKDGFTSKAEAESFIDERLGKMIFPIFRTYPEPIFSIQEVYRKLEWPEG